jgi:hypothetical protein
MCLADGCARIRGKAGLKRGLGASANSFGARRDGFSASYRNSSASRRGFSVRHRNSSAVVRGKGAAFNPNSE